MTGRLAELARRFQDVIDHITDKPFTWGQGDGTLSDQTDLQTALDGKLDLSGIQSSSLFDNAVYYPTYDLGGTGSIGDGVYILLHRYDVSSRVTMGRILGNRSGGTGSWMVDINISSYADNSGKSNTLFSSNLAAMTNGIALRQVVYDGIEFIAIKILPGVSERYPNSWTFTGYSNDAAYGLKAIDVNDSLVTQENPILQNRSDSDLFHQFSHNIKVKGTNILTALDGKADTLLRKKTLVIDRFVNDLGDWQSGHRLYIKFTGEFEWYFADITLTRGESTSSVGNRVAELAKIECAWLMGAGSVSASPTQELKSVTGDNATSIQQSDITSVHTGENREWYLYIENNHSEDFVRWWIQLDVISTLSEVEGEIEIIEFGLEAIP